MLVITPNLCFDVTVELPELVPGSVARATRTVTSAGGKGVNVVRAASAQTDTDQVRLIGFLAETDGPRLAGFLADEGAAFHPVPVGGVVRVATIIIEDSRRVSVINGRGPDITDQAWMEMLALIDEVTGPGELIVCSGSLPPGVPEDGYAQIVHLGHRKGSQVVVDAAPVPLSACWRPSRTWCRPTCPRPRPCCSDERVSWSMRRATTFPTRAVIAARALYATGARRAVVTAGAAGAALCTADGTWWLTAAPVTW